MYSWQRLMVLALWPNVTKLSSKELCYILQGLQWYLIFPTFCSYKWYPYGVPCSCWGPSKHYMYCAQRLMGSHTHNALPILCCGSMLLLHVCHAWSISQWGVTMTWYPTQRCAQGMLAMCFVELYNRSCTDDSWIRGINLTWDWTHCYVLSMGEITWEVIIVLLIYTQF